MGILLPQPPYWNCRQELPCLTHPCFRIASIYSGQAHDCCCFQKPLLFLMYKDKTKMCVSEELMKVKHRTSICTTMNLIKRQMHAQSFHMENTVVELGPCLGFFCNLGSQELGHKSLCKCSPLAKMQSL